MLYPICYIKNASGSDDTWNDQFIEDEEYHQIEDSKRIAWSNNDKVLTDIANGDLIVAMDATGSSDLSGVANQINYLKGDNITVDIEGHQEIKQVIALDAMHYEPRALDFVTSKYNSLYNRKHNGGGIPDGTDYNDAELIFYDGNDDIMSYQQTGYETETETEFQTRLSNSTTGCEKTYLAFTPGYKYGIRSGVVMIREDITYDSYIWCLLAPHIPEAMGGEAPFLAGGYNLSFFPAKSYIRMDGGTVFIMEVDETYYSHRIGLYLKHQAGDQIGFQMIYELYR